MTENVKQGFYEFMSMQALTFKDPITLVGGAYVSTENFKASTQFASNIVAADGGANTCLQYGVKPDAVIGDLDSIEEKSKVQIKDDRIHFVSSQDDTDFEKSLNRINAPLIIGVGFLGDRVDHQMAVQTALVKHYNKKILLIGEHDIVFLTPPEFSLTLENDCRVSLYPMAKCTVVSKGLKWKTEDIVFSPLNTIGTSNCTTEDKIELFPSEPLLLTIIPRDFLIPASLALLASKAWFSNQK